MFNTRELVDSAKEEGVLNERTRIMKEFIDYFAEPENRDLKLMDFVNRVFDPGEI